MEGLGEALNVGGGEMVTLVVSVVEKVRLAVGIGVAVGDADGDVDCDGVVDNVRERLREVDNVALSVVEMLPDAVVVGDNDNVSESVFDIDGVGGKDLVSEIEMANDVLVVGLALVDRVSRPDAVGDAVRLREVIALGVGVALAVG